MDWSELTRPAAQDLLSWYREIIGLKRSAGTAQSLSLQVGCDPTAGWLWYIRSHLCVAVNFSASAATIALPEGNWHLLLTSVPSTSNASVWDAYETRIYSRNR